MVVASARIDGRTSRGLQNRERIVAALLALIREGRVSPTAEEVSVRAGVGLRTVFRHFDDMETLYREVTSAVDAIVAPALLAPIRGETWPERLHDAIRLRADIFEQLMPIHTASLVNLHASPFLRQQQARSAGFQRHLLSLVLPPAVREDSTLFEALDLCLSLESWIRLRRDQQLDHPTAVAVMQRCATQLLGIPT